MSLQNIPRAVSASIVAPPPASRSTRSASAMPSASQTLCPSRGMVQETKTTWATRPSLSSSTRGRVIPASEWPTSTTRESPAARTSSTTERAQPETWSSARAAGFRPRPGRSGARAGRSRCGSSRSQHHAPCAPPWTRTKLTGSPCPGVRSLRVASRRRLRAAEQAPGGGAGRLAALHHDLAMQDLGLVAVGALQQAAGPAREVVGHLGAVEAEALPVDQVQVRLVAGGDDAAVEEAVEARRLARHAPHRELERDALAARAVAHPVRDQESRER